MSVFIVINVQEQNVNVYKIAAVSAEDALSRYQKYQPIQEYQFDKVYGDGTIALPYETIKPIFTYVNMFIGKPDLGKIENVIRFH